MTLAPDLARDQFFTALRDFGREAEKADWAVVYYAGHGMEIGGINYLIPTDAKLAADRDAEGQAVALEQVIAAVSGAHKMRLVMLDACRDNPFEKTMQHTMALKLVSKGLSNIEPEAGFMVVYAAKHGETALDGDALNSPSPPPWRVRSGCRRSRCASCSTSCATTSGLLPSTNSSPSPTDRCRDARIFTSWPESSYTTTLSRFAARVIPVYSHRARLSWNAKLSSNSTTSSHCEPCDLCTVST